MATHIVQQRNVSFSQGITALRMNVFIVVLSLRHILRTVA